MSKRTHSSTKSLGRLGKTEQSTIAKLELAGGGGEEEEAVEP